VSLRLRVEQLRVTYGSRTVVDVDELEAEAGRLAVVVGDAGSGKSTLAAALAGAVSSRGRVAVDGRAVWGPPSQRRRLGLAAALRDGSRVSGCTVAEALRLAAGGTHRDRGALERFPQLAGRRDVMAQLLSGGEQQLLRVAGAWCAAPLVLILDSPTVGLAPDAADAVTRLAREEAERGAAVVWLEQDRRAGPEPPRLHLAHGRIGPAQGSGGADSAGSGVTLAPGTSDVPRRSLS